MHYLYRAYDSSRVLLYVGITNNFASRFAQHEYTSKWMDEVDSIEIERYETKEEAARAEIEAIQKEEPAHNRQHNTRYEAAKEHLNLLADEFYGKRKPIEAHRHRVWSLRDSAEDVYDVPFASVKKNSLLFLLNLNLGFDRAHGISECDDCDAIYDANWDEGRLQKGEELLLSGGVTDATN